ncbi:uncharacterized protein LOC143576666 [Bidens hawaiensis]|uniref:uncharacterized protein LOC143576666 n=1 Tax=Bidens hawaiensis TaxID=980011 RepID=UPI004049BC1E
MESNNTQQINQEEEEDETKGLIINSYNGTGVETVKVVEYMLSSMSKELLHKFPDNSAFDFDYTQSSIWSPLVPHPSRPQSPHPETQRKLSYEEEDEGNYKLKANVKETIRNYSCMFNCFKVDHKFSNKKRRRSSFRGFDHFGSSTGSVKADPVCSSPIQIKGWKKVLKAASKRFKKTMKKKKESGAGAQLKLSSNGFSRISY